MVICTNRDVEIREDTNSFLRLWQEVGTMYRKKKKFLSSHRHVPKCNLKSNCMISRLQSI